MDYHNRAAAEIIAGAIKVLAAAIVTAAKIIARAINYH